MKYGLLFHKYTTNMGDDVQAYAISQFLPQVDYEIDREAIDTFQSKDNEPVATIMSAWWFWKKWNWPPSNCIVPKVLGMHITNYGVADDGSPITNEWVQGVGKDWLEAYGPVGCRDIQTLNFFTENNIPCYFSGCITLTLPKQKKITPEKEYICIVDLRPSLEKKIREILKDSDIEIKVITHFTDYRKSDLTWEDRKKIVQDEYLAVYQNAKCVITRRLHVSLPCLAMEVPVLAVLDTNKEKEAIRWNPYKDWLHICSNKDFLKGNFDYDFLNPPPNPDTYLETRNKIIKDVNTFIEYTKANADKNTEELRKTTYTDAEKAAWQNQVMKTTLDKWLIQSRRDQKSIKKLNKKINDLQQQTEKSKENSKFIKRVKRKLKRMLSK